MADVRLQRSHFSKPAYVTFLAGEAGSQKRIKQIPCDQCADYPSAHAQDVHVVMFHTLTG